MEVPERILYYYNKNQYILQEIDMAKEKIKINIHKIAEWDLYARGKKDGEGLEPVRVEIIPELPQEANYIENGNYYMLSTLDVATTSYFHRIQSGEFLCIEYAEK